MLPVQMLMSAESQICVETELSAQTFQAALSAAASWDIEPKMEKSPSTHAGKTPPVKVTPTDGRLTRTTWLKPALAGASVVDCGQPASAGGTVLLSATATTYSSVATFTCDEGFMWRSGDNSSVCGADGLWTPASIKCEGKNTPSIHNMGQVTLS